MRGIKIEWDEKQGKLVDRGTTWWEDALWFIIIMTIISLAIWFMPEKGTLHTPWGEV